MRLGISKALSLWDRSMRNDLKSGKNDGCAAYHCSSLKCHFACFHHCLCRFSAENLLYRDPRNVERKKPGQKKARKKYQWVKR